MGTGKAEKAEKVLQTLPVEAVLLTSPANMRYAAGFTGEGYVYISRRQRLVVTDSRYLIAAGEECPDFQVREWKQKEYYLPLVEALREDGIVDLGIEDQHMTMAAHEKLRAQLKKSAMEEVATTPLGDEASKLRRVKDEEEWKRISRAEAIGDRAFARIIPKLEVGMSEKRVAALLEFFMKEAGAEGLSFDTIAASGPNSAMPHAVPTDRKLQKGDFLTMDFGCRWKGYCSDMTRTVVMGKADNEQKRIYSTVLRAQQAALDGIRPGMTGKEVDALAREVIEEAGYGEQFGHSLGHSVGLEIHEKPCFSPSDDTVLKPGMVITVEPGIYLEGLGGVRIEDLVVITENGCENLTCSDKELLEIEKYGGNDHD